MKTLKSLSIVVLFTLIASVAFASSHYETRYKVKTCNDLPCVIKQMVKTDFVRLDNYFQQNAIAEINESVEFEFFIDKESRIQVLNTKCENEVASNYVKQLLDDKQISADTTVMNRKYKLKLTIYYNA